MYYFAYVLQVWLKVNIKTPCRAHPVLPLFIVEREREREEEREGERERERHVYKTV